MKPIFRKVCQIDPCTLQVVATYESTGCVPATFRANNISTAIRTLRKVGGFFWSYQDEVNTFAERLAEKQGKPNYRKVNKFALKYPVKVGEQYGAYKVVEETRAPNNAKRLTGKDSYITLWKCVNIHTGKVIFSRGSELHHLAERAAKKFEEQSQRGFRNFLYGSTKRNARKRKHGFYLTFSEFNEIISKPCHYCGEEPREMTPEMTKNRGDIHQPPIRYNGIDRIDPQGDYSVENCVPCCPICNYMKHVQKYDDFMAHVAKIYHHCIEKNNPEKK